MNGGARTSLFLYFFPMEIGLLGFSFSSGSVLSYLTYVMCLQQTFLANYFILVLKFIFIDYVAQNNYHVLVSFFALISCHFSCNVLSSLFSYLMNFFEITKFLFFLPLPNQFFLKSPNLVYFVVLLLSLVSYFYCLFLLL